MGRRQNGICLSKSQGQPPIYGHVYKENGDQWIEGYIIQNPTTPYQVEKQRFYKHIKTWPRSHRNWLFIVNVPIKQPIMPK